jgi:16S rRNA processing protein RimM
VPEPALLEVGKITRPHGLRGAVVVELVSNREERLRPGSAFTGPSGPLTVEQSHPLGASGGRARVAMNFSEVPTREAAEALRGAVLRAPALADADADTDTDTLWVHELIGAEVVTADGTVIGRVDAVEANPASDLLVLDSGPLVPLHFVIAQAPGRVTVELPAGLLDL